MTYKGSVSIYGCTVCRWLRAMNWSYCVLWICIQLSLHIGGINSPIYKSFSTEEHVQANASKWKKNDFHLLAFYCKIPISETHLIFSPYTESSILQELKRCDYVVMPVTNTAMHHNPHMPMAKSQREKLKSEWKCMLSFRIFQLFPLIKTKPLRTYYTELTTPVSRHWKQQQSAAKLSSDDQNIQAFGFKPPSAKPPVKTCAIQRKWKLHFTQPSNWNHESSSLPNWFVKMSTHDFREDNTDINWLIQIALQLP